MRLLSLAIAAGICAITACSGTPVPDPPDVSGIWTFTYTNLSSGAIQCHGTLTLNISQTGEVFTGQQLGTGTIGCNGAVPAFAMVAPDDSNVVIGGEVLHAGRSDGGDVAFALEQLDSQDAGSVTSPSAMSGTSTWNLPIQPHGTLLLHGNWSAVKQ
ncbi:MAG TPA: hypothetical protein VGL65_12420 [Gemmatimonadales bacterium]|jgi:hypothetical protein